MALERFLEVYQQLNRHNLGLLSEIYTEDIRFVDPAHRVIGLTALEQYFRRLYDNLEQIEFDFHSSLAVADQAFIQWRMRLRHPRLNRGRVVEITGISCLHFGEDGRVDEHCDYFDLGALLYEPLPLLGGLVRTIKKRFSS